MIHGDKGSKESTVEREREIERDVAHATKFKLPLRQNLSLSYSVK